MDVERPSPHGALARQGEILVVAATSRELAAGGAWRTLECGVGPVEAAARTAAAISVQRPAAILHVGIAGARRNAGIVPPSLVIGSEAQYDDLGVGPEWAPSVVVPSQILLDAARRVLPAARVTAIGTSARVGGTSTPVEGMEGFAVLRAAQLAGVPALEVRAISNLVEEGDRAKWMFAEAFAAIVAATPRLVEEIAACVS